MWATDRIRKFSLRLSVANTTSPLGFSNPVTGYADKRPNAEFEPLQSAQTFQNEVRAVFDVYFWQNDCVIT
jgi:hypothetical protein